MQNKKTKFVIFGQGRSGSTLLKELLDSHPQIICEGELFNIEDNYVTNWFLRKMIYSFPMLFFEYRRFLHRKANYGFTLLYYQFSPVSKLLHKLEKSGWKIIYIHRINTLQQVLSFYVADKTKFWHRRNESEEKPLKINIEINEFLSALQMIANAKIKVYEIMNQFKHCKVIYEQHLKNENVWQLSMNHVFEYLCIDSAKVHSNLQKTYSASYSDLVENYEDILEKVKQSSCNEILLKLEKLNDNN